VLADLVLGGWRLVSTAAQLGQRILRGGDLEEVDLEVAGQADGRRAGHLLSIAERRLEDNERLVR
jgi:hypothetical protein